MMKANCGHMNETMESGDVLIFGRVLVCSLARDIACFLCKVKAWCLFGRYVKGILHT